VRAAEVSEGHLRQAPRLSRMGNQVTPAAPALVAPGVLIELMVVVIIVVVVIRAETAGFRVDRYSLGLSVLGCDDAKILSIDNQVNIRPAIRQHFFPHLLCGHRLVARNEDRRQSLLRHQPWQSGSADGDYGRQDGALEGLFHRITSFPV
jgi:hypothetical protein